jgi:hypothetical protein
MNRISHILQIYRNLKQVFSISRKGQKHSRVLYRIISKIATGFHSTICIGLLQMIYYEPYMVNSIQSKSGDGYILTEIYILHGIQNFDAFRHGPLECLAAGDQPHATGPLIDNRRADCLGQVAGAA